jgi:hypothetical protein
MDQVTVVFTKNVFSPISWFIRWCLPRSRFAFAISSHCLIKVGEETYDMGFGKPVYKVSWDKAMKGRSVVATRSFIVPNLQAGIDWAEEQIGKKYDIKGAVGITIYPDRDWSEEDAWFCYEFAAGFLKACGLDIFHYISHVTETVLLSLKTS